MFVCRIETNDVQKKICNKNCFTAGGLDMPSTVALGYSTTNNYS